MKDDIGPGSVSWRDEDGHKRSPVHSGYEFEAGFREVGGKLVSECEAYRIASGVAESERPLFEWGWRVAAELKPPMESDIAFLHGWNAYPRRKWEDPYKSFTEDYARREMLKDRDAVSEDIRRKSKKPKRVRATHGPNNEEDR